MTAAPGVTLTRPSTRSSVRLTPGPDGWGCPDWPELAGDLTDLVPVEDYAGPSSGPDNVALLDAAVDLLLPEFPDARRDPVEPSPPGVY